MKLRRSLFFCCTDMNTVACNKCGNQTTNTWKYCDACPTLEGAASVVFPTKPDLQKAFIDKLIEEEISIAQLLSFTRDDDGMLKDLGLAKAGQRITLYDWIEKMKGL